MSEEQSAMYRVLYRSRLRDGRNHSEGGDAILREILLTSKRNNAAANLTGALLYLNGTFVKALEGPGNALEQRFEAICRDHRQTDLELIDFDTTSERAFSSWAMADVNRHSRCERTGDHPIGPRLDALLDCEDAAVLVARFRQQLGAGS